MRMLLEHWRCRVIQAVDVGQALKLIADDERMPDLILADYHLEDETGVDCIEAIRRHSGYSIPAILITADRSPAVEAEVRGKGLYLLRKPVKPAALRALMSRLHMPRAAAE
jgi:CheY-like chemotaxis protein